MSLLRFGHVLAWVLLAPVALLSAQPDKPAPRPKAPATPEEALRQYAEAIRTGDAERMLALLPKKTREQFKQIEDARARPLTHWKNAEDAVDEKFGKPAPPKAEAPRKAEPAPQATDKNARIELLSKEQTKEQEVVLKARVTYTGFLGEKVQREAKFAATKEKDGWTLVETQFHKSINEVAEVFEVLDRLDTLNRPRVERFIKDVKSGKYKTRSEAEEALEEVRKIEIPAPAGAEQIILPDPFRRPSLPKKPATPSKEKPRDGR